MTGAAELRRLQYRSHHRATMRRDIVEYLLIANTVEQPRAIFLEQPRRLAHDVAANPTSVYRLHRVAGDARYTIVIERPFDFRVLRQSSGEQRCRVMTRLTMPGEFNSLLVLQVLDVLLIERFAKSIAVR